MIRALFLPELFLSASFLELLEQSLAIILAHQRPLVVNRKAADLVALRRLRKMADGSRRGAELLEQVAESLFCFCWSHACWCLIIHEPGLGCKTGWLRWHKAMAKLRIAFCAKFIWMYRQSACQGNEK